jgi:hypothetical protein
MGVSLFKSDVVCWSCFWRSLSLSRGWRFMSSREESLDVRLIFRNKSQRPLSLILKIVY